ncbi:hypothetical protein [Flagellimonas sp. S3867]|uniref:hypothetical protein n=1 Tax=Flagellimonas sp. S3867 TaxID=2768063 RepID=UPI001686A9FB|nr:hypothetical protein [Flagellimonas sp. S3867]
MKKIIRYIIGFIIGFISVFVIQFALTKIWSLAGVEWGPENLPVENIQKMAVLSSTFISGLIGPFISLLICKNSKWIIIGLFFLIAMSIDLYAVLNPLKELELWFKLVFVILIPIQLLLAIKLFDFFKKKTNLH